MPEAIYTETTASFCDFLPKKNPNGQDWPRSRRDGHENRQWLDVIMK